MIRDKLQTKLLQPAHVCVRVCVCARRRGSQRSPLIGLVSNSDTGILQYRKLAKYTRGFQSAVHIARKKKSLVLLFSHTTRVMRVCYVTLPAVDLCVQCNRLVAFGD